ncbi:ATPase family AAA domain-containing protein [Fusarium circinatum]|uniref:ATPase family AAA domain-containing protein n=1 Tax=Fusarium circinatum TaxID=48490 RepID=A0A8H5T3L2_FUSCI|nr:ATPase family AAA domain-containing protein [Fusarium circinatum]
MAAPQESAESANGNIVLSSESNDYPLPVENPHEVTRSREDAQVPRTKEVLDVEPKSDTEDDIDKADYGYTREEVMAFAADLATEDLYDLYVKRLKSLEENQTGGQPQRRSSKLAKSVIDYVRILEERIGRLENAEPAEAKVEQKPNANSLDDAGAVSGDAAPDDASDAATKNKPLEVKFFLGATEFNRQGKYTPDKTKSDTFSCDTDSQHFIRALFNWIDGADSQPAGNDEPDPAKADLISLRVESTHISDFLKASGNLSTSLYPSLRMRKPFRPLLQNYHVIKEQLSKLERRYDAQDVESNTDQATDTTQPIDDLPFIEEPGYEKIEALDHFKVLVSFIDKYLHKQISHLERIKLGKWDKISFDNLWMLFTPGSTIHCPFRDVKKIGDYTAQPQYVPQAFRVVGALGGVPSISSFTPTFDEERNIRNDIGVLDGLCKSQDGFRATGPASRRINSLFSPLHVMCFNIDFDGIKYGVVEHIFHFKPFHGQVDIQSLEAYPVQFNKLRQAGEDPIAGFSQRGEKFVDATLVSHLCYEGLTVGKSREEVESDVIVDFKLAYTEKHEFSSEPNVVAPKFQSLQDVWFMSTTDDRTELATLGCGISGCTIIGCGDDAYPLSQKTQAEKMKVEVEQLLEDYEPRDLSREDDLRLLKQNMRSDGLLYLLPGVVPGFALRNKTWVLLDLKLLKEPENIDDWDQLVLPKGHRKMVQAMVETYAKGSHTGPAATNSRHTHAGMDIVRGKGKGCIILLHGVPGVGKTSTAGDIGYAPEKVEENMEKHFRLAHRWGCVLLLDEADVFLAKRSKADVKRNGLVSVFLRIMEYYSGILFLTTNRVGAIDDAFRSRLHLTLYYPKLSKRQTRTIWENNIERLHGINEKRQSEQAPIIDFDSKKILKWVDLNWEVLQWNGRQIKNAFQTALALAEFQAKHSRDPDAERTLEVKHFRTIADATTRFNEYLLATHGFDEEETARREKIRTIGFTPLTRVKDLPESDDDESEEDSSEDSDDSDSKKRKRRKTKGKKTGKRVGKEVRSTKRDKKVSKNKSEPESESEDEGEEVEETETTKTVATKKRERRKSNN